MESIRLERLRRCVDQATAQRDILQASLTANRARLADLQARAENLAQAREIIIAVGKMTQQQLELQISNLVSMALATVFDDPYEFKVQFTERRNVVEADFFLIRDGVYYDPMESVGGGVLDVVAFGLRVADWRLRGGRSVMILDEQFRNVWPAGQPKVNLLLRRISKELNLQIILVSHQDKVNEGADKVFRIVNGHVTVLE
jgi:DNA repair exonuclease SbcCD ATPase subunit